MMLRADAVARAGETGDGYTRAKTCEMTRGSVRADYGGGSGVRLRTRRRRPSASLNAGFFRHA